MIEQAHAERMKSALTHIADRMQDYIESGGEPEFLPSPERVLHIARRALDPDEWERVHD